MEINLKQIDFDDISSFDNPKDIEKLIALEIERRNNVNKACYKNLNDLKYAEGVFALYNIHFDKDYKDIENFLKAKRGVLFTTVPYKYEDTWMYLSYDIIYYELDLEHIYTIEELVPLVKVGKIVLLSGKPYISVPSKEEYGDYIKIIEKELTTIEEYNFEDMKKNSLASNYLIAKMIMLNFDYSQSLSEVTRNLIIKLKEYREVCLNLKKQNNDEYDEIATSCHLYIEEMIKRK